MTIHDSAEREQTLDRVYEVAFNLEGTYGCCPQCVLAALQDVLSVGSDELVMAAHPLTGGAGLSLQGTCGALNGAILAVGWRYGRDRAHFGSDEFGGSFALGKRVFDAFVETFGSPTCRDVQTKLMGRSYDFWDPQEFEAFLADGGHDDKCTHVVGTAARIAAEALLDAEAEG
ncbi:MAG: C-GCAxxG-C-C family protein [Dehalococcoidales bacterium]|nr:C-GCAxxG-C-C family protein [Dehalococcoidales bacterium]